MFTVVKDPPIPPDLLEPGWHPGSPPWITPDTLAIDVQVAQQMPCERCGYVGCGYVAVHHRAKREYKAFARCPCGAHTEF